MKSNNFADIISLCRIFFSVLMLLFSAYSPVFAVLYLLCGISDITDGFVARKLHIETKKGAMLDSIADLFFALSYAVKILPLLHIPVWVLIWTVLIAAVKIFGIFKNSKKEGGFYIPHSFLNRLTGCLIFLLPVSVGFVDAKYGCVAVCTAASLAAAEELRR